MELLIFSKKYEKNHIILEHVNFYLKDSTRDICYILVVIAKTVKIKKHECKHEVNEFI